ncbi:amino acid transporter ANT1 [Selaginella moellendorffii]|nr:amino acid transporter ANT1 [Selaginella moellendorffii]|eukprot:XP_002964049.2 amino acid transporter ANT1 [Selaginella moellendorffii]
MVDEATALLPRSSLLPGGGEGASVRKTFANIIISILGSGVLGLPFTYRVSGWAVAATSITLAGGLSYYCMILLVKCRDKLSSNGGHHFIQTYPDLGYHTFGNLGRQVIEVTLLISQAGCCVAYLIFIGHNLSSVFFPDSKYALVIAILVPLEILLAWVRSLASLAPFSIFANVCNVLAMAIVIKEDLGRLHSTGEKMATFKGWQSVPFALGVCIYCYEGFGMTLSLQASMRKPHKFARVLGLAFGLITTVYLVFGLAGYAAFGEETLDIVTLNLGNRDWSTKLVKLGLSIALFFTFPVMMYPVYEIFEGRLLLNKWFQRSVVPSPRLLAAVTGSIRGVVVVVVALIAVAVPGFGTFISLVGSTVCALLAFVFPALFHARVCADAPAWSRAVDATLVVFGVVFAVYGTYQTCTNAFVK